MRRSGLRHALATALVIGTILPVLTGVPAVQAASPHASAPPTVDATRPVVSGRLVAKGTTSATTTTPVSCGDRDRTPEARAMMVARGLVVCTEEGKLVLLQMARGTGIFNRDWQRIAYSRLALGDRLNAWGILRANGFLLNPTVAIQDLSRTDLQLQTVTGRLVAKPGGEAGGPVICGDRDRSPEARSLMVNRGLVVCTEEGTLVLLQISGTTKLYAHDRSRVTIEDFTIGDALKAWGTLHAGGFLLDPTVAVVDASIQRKDTNSQDFVAAGGPVLTLYVLKSDAGPVQGIVHALPGEPSHITLCGGVRGAWSNLTRGLTINISHSVFNTRTMTYVDTNTVTVVSCR